MATADDDALSDEVRELADAAHQRARRTPAESDVRNLAAEAMARGTASADEINAILDQAIDQLRKIRELAAVLPRTKDSQ